MKAPQYQVGGSSTHWGAFISGCMKAPQYHKFWCFNAKLPDDISLLWWLLSVISTFENVRKTPPAKRLTQNQKVRGPSNLANSIVLSKMLPVFFSIHNPLFSALRGFHTSRNERPSRCTRSPNLVLRGFHNLRRISFAALWLLSFLVCLYICVCECLLHNNVRMYTSNQYVRGPLQGCRSIRPGASGLPYYCAPLVCVSEVIQLLAVWLHNKPVLLIWIHVYAFVIYSMVYCGSVSRYTTRKRACEESRTLRDSYCMEKHFWYVYTEMIRI